MQSTELKTITVWGYKEASDQIYTFEKTLAGEMVKGTFRSFTAQRLKLSDIAEECEGVCGPNSKPENQGKKYKAWKHLETGAFIQGTFKTEQAVELPEKKTPPIKMLQRK